MLCALGVRTPSHSWGRVGLTYVDFPSGISLKPPRNNGLFLMIPPTPFFCKCLYVCECRANRRDSKLGKKNTPEFCSYFLFFCGGEDRLRLGWRSCKAQKTKESTSVVPRDERLRYSTLKTSWFGQLYLLCHVWTCAQGCDLVLSFPGKACNVSN